MDEMHQELDDLETDIPGWEMMYDSSAVADSVAEVISSITNTNGLQSNLVDADEDVDEFISGTTNDERSFDDSSNLMTDNETNCNDGLGINIPNSLSRRERKNLKRRELVECPTCGKTLNRGSMSKHAKTHNKVKKFECEICGRGYNRLDYFEKHRILHVDKKPYKCTVCGKAFNLSRKLISHETIHTGLKPFICSICNTSFTESSALYKHMRGMHEGNKPFECSFCGKTFNESAKVKRHMRVHTGEKPYVCHICSRAFNDRSAQLKHIRSHKGYESFAVAAYSANGRHKKVGSDGKPIGVSIDISPNVIRDTFISDPNGVNVKKEIEIDESYGHGHIFPPFHSDDNKHNEHSLPPISSYYEDELKNFPVECDDNEDLNNNNNNDNNNNNNNNESDDETDIDEGSEEEVRNGGMESLDDVNNNDCDEETDVDGGDEGEAS